MTARPYIGTGIKHPHEINEFGRIELEDDIDLIKQSLIILFNTPLGSEFYREDFGSNIRQAIFEPNDSVVRSLLDYFIIDAIAKWERRINVVDVKYDQPPQSPDLVNCQIIFKVKQSSEIDSFIFPFYRELKN